MPFKFINPRTCEHQWAFEPGTDGFGQVCVICDSHRTTPTDVRDAMLRELRERNKPKEPVVPYPFPPMPEE